MTKTEAEMFNRLKRLEKEIRTTENMINKHRKRFMTARLGPNYASKRLNNLDRNNFTENQYKNFVREALRLSYNVHMTQMTNYKRTVNKYRARLGLPHMNKIGGREPNAVSYTTSTRFDPHNRHRINLEPLVRPYRNIRWYPQLPTGGGGGRKTAATVIFHNKFYPNVQLLNKLRPTHFQRNMAMIAALSAIPEKTLRNKIIRSVRST